MVDIEWDDWTAKPYVYTWQAAALVQGLNPKKIKFPVRDAAGELHFDRSNFGNAYPDFKAKLDIVIEHAWIQNFSAQNMRVDFKRFLYWAHHTQKWSMPSALLAVAQSLNLDVLTDTTEVVDSTLQDERNTLQLIWALRQLLNQHQYGKTDRELIYYLSKTYPDQAAFKRSALEMKFAEAKATTDT